METSIQGTLGSEHRFKNNTGKTNRVWSITVDRLLSAAASAPVSCSVRTLGDTCTPASGNNSSLLSPQKTLHHGGLTQKPPGKVASATLERSQLGQINHKASKWTDLLLSGVCPRGDRQLFPGARGDGQFSLEFRTKGILSIKKKKKAWSCKWNLNCSLHAAAL